MAKSNAEYQQKYRERARYKQYPFLHPACQAIAHKVDDTEWMARCEIVRVYGQYPAPTRKPRQGKTPAEYQREYRKRARFKAAMDKVERLNSEQFQ